MTMETDLLRKIKEWQEKANAEDDPFDKYISMFIAYNIFYNLYEMKRTNNFDEDSYDHDRDKAINAIKLSNSVQLFDEISAELDAYLKMIPVFREEYWPRKNLGKGKQGLPLAKSLKAAFLRSDKNEVVKLLVRWLYRVRCNLVHGTKSY